MRQAKPQPDAATSPDHADCQQFRLKQMQDLFDREYAEECGITVEQVRQQRAEYARRKSQSRRERAQRFIKAARRAGATRRTAIRMAYRGAFSRMLIKRHRRATTAQPRRQAAALPAPRSRQSHRVQSRRGPPSDDSDPSDPSAHGRRAARSANKGRARRSVSLAGHLTAAIRAIRRTTPPTSVAWEGGACVGPNRKQAP